MPLRTPSSHPAFQRSATRSAYPQNMAVYRNQAGRQPPAPSKKRRFGMVFRTILLLAVILLGAHIFWSKQTSADRAAQAQATAAAAARSVKFSQQVNALIIANPQITFSMATLTSNQGLRQYGTTTAFDGASVGKVLTAADYLQQVQNHSASLATNIDGHTANYWLQIMLVNSDDTAWAELNGYLTHPDLQTYASSIGFSQYDPNTDTFTAGDVAGLLQKLYNGNLLDAANRSLLLNYLSRANYRNYIVAAVPTGDNVYHKIGLDNDEVNDAAIITHGQQYVILVIFTNGNGTYDWGQRAQLMQSLASDAIAAYL